jgi:hypothetical protein
MNFVQEVVNGSKCRREFAVVKISVFNLGAMSYYGDEPLRPTKRHIQIVNRAEGGCPVLLGGRV